MYVYLPENFCLEVLRVQFPPDFKMDDKKCKYLVSLLNEVPFYNNNLKKGVWIPLNATKLQNVGIRKFTKYKEWLQKAGIIEIDNRYWEGRSRRYRLINKYRSRIKIERLDDSCFTRKVQKEILSSKTISSTTDFLFEDLCLLEVDYDKAIEYLNRTYRSSTVKRASTIMKYNSSLIGVHKIHTEQFFYTLDDTSSRLHTNLTSLKTDMRQFLRYKKESLANIDIKNSQPFFSAAIFDLFFWKTNFFYPKRLDMNELRKRINKRYKEVLTALHPIMLAKLNNSIFKSEIHSYRNLLTSGKFYEFIRDKVNKTSSRSLNRSQAKKMMLVVLFSHGENLSSDVLDLKCMFQKLFPTIYELFEEIKNQKPELLAIILQSIESHIVIEATAKRIKKEHPDIPLFTIHDSICSTVKNKELIKNYLEEEIIKAIGINPSLKIEYWDKKTELNVLKGPNEEQRIFNY